MPAVPDTMTAILIREPGGPDVLVPARRPVPEPGDGEVLIKVEAAGVNRPDIAQRQGHYPPPPGVTTIPGLEIAGTIVARGRNTEGRAVGDEVTALVAGGGYAEYCVAHATHTLPLPDGFDMVQAAALPETFFTVWSNLFDQCRLEPGETLLVHGGASGIGTTAIQIAKAFGAIVVVTVGSDAKADACRSLGADLAINHRTEDFVKAVRDFTEGRGADVILDMVGGKYLQRNYAVAARDGRIAQIAFIAGPSATVDFTPLMAKRLIHTGSTLRPRTIPMKAAIAQQLATKVWPLLALGQIRPVIDSTFRLDEAAEAHRRLEAGEHIGKVMLIV